MKRRVCILGVTRTKSVGVVQSCLFSVQFKRLKKGRKKVRHYWVHAQDELDAYQRAKRVLESKAI